MPQFLLYFYLRREAKAGFDKQGWILFLRFISTGGTLWDKNSVSQKAALGSQPKWKQMPWECSWCHHWEASQTGNTNPHKRPRYDDSTFTRSCFCLRIHGCKAREVEKAEISSPQVIQRTVRGPFEKHLNYYTMEATIWLAFYKFPKAWETQLIQSAQVGPSCHIWDTY